MTSVLAVTRRPSGAWGRLKAPPVDVLESYGLPSKGDNRHGGLCLLPVLTWLSWPQAPRLQSPRDLLQ